MRNASKMVEIRFFLQYGDYLAESLRRLRGSNFEETIWKRESLNWCKVARHLDFEDQKHDEYCDIWRRKNHAMPDLKVSTDVSAAVRFTGTSPADLRWETRA